MKDEGRGKVRWSILCIGEMTTPPKGERRGFRADEHEVDIWTVMARRGRMVVVRKRRW